MGEGDTIWRKATIADTASLSDAVDVLGWEVVAFQQPAACNGTVYTAQASMDGNSFAMLTNDVGTEWEQVKSGTVAEATMLSADNRIRGYSQIKVRTGTQAAPSAQNGEAEIMVGLAKL